MKPIAFILFFVSALLAGGQSYVDSGIRHFMAKEYDEALVDFAEAEKVKVMFTESSVAKIYFYRGLIWLERAEKRDFAESDPIRLAYENLSEVAEHDDSWEEQITKAYARLNVLVMEQADAYEKQSKKADGADAKTELLDRRIECLVFAEKLGVNSSISALLGETNKEAGDIIFENAADLEAMTKAKKYYEEAIRHYEIARYDDPFNKSTINTILELARKLDDAEKVKEYTLLLDLAGG